MGFRVLYGSPQTLWAPLVDSATVAIGQIVVCQANEGVSALAVATGANDSTNKQVPMGVVIGTNNYVPSYSSTYGAEKITDTSPLASTVDYRLQEGPYPKGDKVAMVKIALITPETVLEGPIFNAALGTAMTVGTVSTGDANGVSLTTSALEVAGVATLATLYFRSGTNMGSYRITDDASTTLVKWDKPTTYAVAVGDTVVRANGLRVFGPSRAYIDSNCTYIDASAALTTNYLGIDVIRLDLSTAGAEYVQFKFNLDHFTGKRA